MSFQFTINSDTTNNINYTDTSGNYGVYTIDTSGTVSNFINNGVVFGGG